MPGSNQPAPVKTLILGLGNILMGDEGIGVRSIEFMQERPLPDHAELLDGGTGGFHLLSLFQEYKRFVIIDATLGTYPSGEVHVLKPRFASDFPRSLTSHDIGLRDLLQSAELLGDLPEIFLVTINIGEYNTLQTKISRELEAVLPRVRETVLHVLETETNSPA
jgi:hydrogenase maturation protease